MNEFAEEYGETIIGVILGGSFLGIIAALFLIPGAPFSGMIEHFIANL